MTSGRGDGRVTVWVVWRSTEAEDIPLQMKVVAKEVLPTREEAEAEALRLNSLVADEPQVTYFVQASRYYPEGRGAKTGY